MSFWNIVELVILLSSLVLLVIGFNKNNRKILLVAWVCLFVAFTIGDIVTGFVDGLRGT